MLLGIDIGGTTINLGLVKDNQIVHKITVPSFAPDATFEETLQHLEKASNKHTIIPAYHQHLSSRPRRLKDFVIC